MRIRLSVCLAVFAFLLPASSTSVGGPDGLTVAVDGGGTYTIAVPSLNWTFAGSISAPLANVIVASASDGAGAYSEISFDFVTDIQRHAAIRSYWNRPAVLFTVTNYAPSANSFAFPNLSQYPNNLRHLAFSGTFAPPSFSSLDAASPWIFFDSSSNAFILSPAANFMTAVNTQSPAGGLASGISPAIPSLPQGFQHRTLLVMQKGINAAFETWGQALTSLYGKTRPAYDADVILNKIGYWTDNGATYYYHMQGSMNYEQTLYAVKANFDSMGIPLGYLQLDSWFYPKGPGALWSNNGQGIYQYMAATPPFSAGLAKFQQNLGVPLVTHARWIDPSSPYRQTYKMSGNVVIDPTYWDYVAGYLANSGALTFEQDWLNDNAHADFNLTDSDAFLDNMAASMSRRGLTMQYCMGSARHFLQSTKYNNLTTIRTSADRLARDKWTSFLYTSRLASALGVWPFTDNFLSTEATQLLLATLSAGPIGIGDPIGSISSANLLHAVRHDGVIVKPDVPLAPIDASFQNMAQGVDTPQIAATWSDFGSLRTWYVFAYPQGSNTEIKLHPADAGVTQTVYAYDYAAGIGQLMDAADVIDRQITGDAVYLVLAPVGASGIAVVGDPDQFVTMGKKRIRAFEDDGTVALTVAFAPGETSRTIVGYAPWQPAAAASDGAIASMTYDSKSQQFRLALTPGADASASIRVGRAHRKPVPRDTLPAATQ
ncbi:MAG TPA: hypothetical protein VMH28_17110 [Candidatus Acidoferrales bacterium]|nr:hypothetical protein [Candidatus Acidoferrales bacterium]